MFVSDKGQLWDLKLDNLRQFWLTQSNVWQIGKGITAASGNFDDHLDLLELLCIIVTDFLQDAKCLER